MKLNVTNILLGVLILILVWQNFFNQEVVEPQPVTVTIPEASGTTGTQYIEPKVVVVQVPVGDNRNIEVDSYWKQKYEQATSRQKDSLYNEAIKINKYNDTVVDDDYVTIKANATTRGSLLDFKVDYTRKNIDFTYDPIVQIKRPSLSMGIGVEGGVPTVPETNFLLKGDVYFENSKGNGFSLGYDTDKRVWVGLRKTFKLIK